MHVCVSRGLDGLYTHRLTSVYIGPVRTILKLVVSDLTRDSGYRLCHFFFFFLGGEGSMVLCEREDT